MINIRRWYIYLMCLITIETFSWSLIALSRKVFLKDTSDRSAIALQLAVIIVSLPIFLGHWFWGQRLASERPDERLAFQRRLYLYLVAAAALLPAINSLFLVVRAQLFLIFSLSPIRNFTYSNPPTNRITFISSICALIVLTIVWAYHRAMIRRDDRLQGENEAAVVLGQLYGYLFSAVGLFMLSYGIGSLLVTLIGQIFPDQNGRSQVWSYFLSDLIRALIGIVVWLYYWSLAQKAFARDAEQERPSIVRKAYLYLVVFVAALAFIIVTAVLLGDLFQRLFKVSRSNGGLDIALVALFVAGGIWAYHAYVLRLDAKMATEVSQQAQIRRIYSYLMLALSWGALLVGLTGILTVIFGQIGDERVTFRFWRDLSRFLATTIVGGVVWGWHWRRVSKEVNQPALANINERSAFIRQLYLYFYLLVASLTLLGSAIYIISQLIILILFARENENFVLDISQTLSYALLAVGVWLFHGRTLRQDSRIVALAEVSQLKRLKVAVVDADDGVVGMQVVEKLRLKAPGAIILPVGLTETASRVMNETPAEQTALERLAEAEIIVGSWSISVPAEYGGNVSPEVAAAITNSPAQKILYPEPKNEYTWIGVENWNIGSIADDVAETVHSMTLGGAAASPRRLGTWAIVFIVLGSLCGLTILASVLIDLIGRLL